MQRAVGLARQVAPSDATVLLRGEFGTGKGLLARAIHRWSRRADRPLVLTVCVGGPAERFDRELFAHLRTSSDGAPAGCCGAVAAADGGTLFLDEIGDLPAAVQPELLRFLEARECECVGDSLTRRAGVRVIAATSVDLQQAIAGGRFREDLYHRLNVIQIDLPPLRERPEDIVPTAERLLAEFASQRRRPGMRFASEALAAMREYAWPGNFPELRNVVERACLVCRGDGRVGPEHLLLNWSSGPPLPRAGDAVPIARMEELHIRGVLARAPSIERAAAILEMSPVTLWRRRRKYGI